MKKNDKKELLTKEVSEINRLLVQTKQELINLRLEKSQNKLKNTRQLTSKRKNVAIMLTVLSAKLRETKGRTTA